ncbi:ubiquitin-conjugating enzyme/RWD-like protein [Tanacetum coccineum]|uniref:Ubiquitin-conjugating enzyme/RWD-like protein n=1 Tax=Tanacetum coccineum TaxID=301880 RepID=A0ABQ5CVN1_9ASTR
MMGDTIAGGSPSLLYNENILIKSLRTMVCTMTKPPKHFEPFVPGHFCNSAQDILMACYSYKLLEKAFNKLEAKEVEGFLHQIETSSPPPASAATPVVDEDLYAAVVRKMKVIVILLFLVPDSWIFLRLFLTDAKGSVFITIPLIRSAWVYEESHKPISNNKDMDFRWGGDPDIVLGIALLLSQKIESDTAMTADVSIIILFLLMTLLQLTPLLRSLRAELAVPRLQGSTERSVSIRYHMEFEKDPALVDLDGVVELTGPANPITAWLSALS